MKGVLRMSMYAMGDCKKYKEYSNYERESQCSGQAIAYLYFFQLRCFPPVENRK